MSTKSLGYHILLDFYGCDAEIINDVDFLRRLGYEAARVARLNVIGENHHQFSPQGVTVVLMIEESHISFHSWPEHHFLAVDLFTCGSVEAAKKAVEHLQQRLPCTKVVVKEVQRGSIQ